jgi:creatinine amidohydrolase
MADDVRFRLEELRWPEVRAAATAGRVILQPLGAIEQHGHHLPVNTDNLIVDSLCAAAAEAAAGEFLVAPVVPYGFNDHNMEFPGTVSIRVQTLIDYLYDVGHSFATMGFRHMIWVNGHGSNVPVVELAARQVSVDSPMRCAVTSSIALAVSCAADLRTSPIGGVAHACEFETSLYLHLRPDLVDEQAEVDEIAEWVPAAIDRDWFGSGGPLRYMPWYSQKTRSGVEGSPSHASREKGAEIFARSVSLLVRSAREFRDMEPPARTDARPEGAWPDGLRSRDR